MVIRHLWALWRVQRILLKYGLDELIHPFKAWKYVRFWVWLMPSFWRHGDIKRKPRGERCRLALIELGIIFIKLGQALSARRDFVPADIADELAHLQDDCPSFSSELAQHLIEEQLGEPIETLFQSFESEPMASASIAQVHGAVLHSGESVVVKVVRPDIQTRIAASVQLMQRLADLVDRFVPSTQRLHPKQVVEEFSSVLWHETNMLREAANASSIKRNFQGDHSMYVANIFWDYTTQSVLVMERIEGITVTDLDRIDAKGMDRKALAEAGVVIFFKQVFRDNLFHADMHPGNVMVGFDGVYKAIDFGIVGSLNESDKRYLAENFIAFFNRDYRRVAQLHVDSGWVRSDTRVEEFEAAIRTISEPIMGLPLSQISFGRFLLQLFSVARSFEMEVQPQLVLLQKTLFNVEGLGRQLYPDLDLWATAKPFLESWIKEHYSVRSMLKELKQHWPALREDLPFVIKGFIQSNKRYY